MNKLFKFLILILMIHACSYERVYLNQNYNFKFENISSEGNEEINKSIINFLESNTNGDVKYNLYFKTTKNREIVTSDTKGDPKIYKLVLTLQYEIDQNGNKIIQDKIIKQMTYNTIKDKYELSQYEINIMKNLSENLSKDILFAVKVLNK